MPAVDLTDVVILCGGLGTRLRPVLSEVPKPMAPMGDKPFLELILDEVSRQGFRRFILCTGYRAEAISGYFRGSPDRTFVISHEEKPLGTAGALKNCAPHLAGGPFIVLNGDSFCRVDLGGMLKHRALKNAMAVIASAPARGRQDGGLMETDREGRVTAFLEKAPATHLRLNAGIYVFAPEFLDKIPAGKSCSLENDIFPSLSPDEIYAFPSDSPVYDIGTPERLQDFRRRLSEKGAP